MDPRVAQIKEVLLRLAAGHYAARAEPSSRRDEIDALMTGVNMLAETLEAEHLGRLAAEELLQDERQGYEDSPGLSVSIDLDHVILSCNQTFCRVLGQPKEALIGTRIETHHPPPQQKTLTDFLRRRAHSSDDESLSLRFEPEEGEAREVVLRTSAVIPAGRSTPSRLRLLYIDVTQERELQRQLRHAEKMEAIGRLAGGITHEFNNFLTVIRSTTSLLLEDVPDEGLRADLSDIDLAASRASDLTRQLLTLVRRDHDQGGRTEVNLAIRETMRLLDRVLDERIEVDVATDPDVGAVLLEPGELEQILLNLAINARDAMLPEGGRFSVTTSRCRWPDATGGSTGLPQRCVCLSVSDTGKGIPSEVRERIFEPFFTTKPVGHGTGLGLATVLSIVEGAKGTVRCVSETGRGTTFSVILPEAADDAARPSTRAPASSPRPSTRERILLVEDEELVRAVGTRILVKAGFEVVAAASAADARRLAPAHAPFGLLVADAVLTDEPGVELARRFLVEGRAQSALLISGHAIDRQLRDGELGPVGFVSKPFTPAELLAEVRALLDRRRARDEPRPGAE